MLSSELKDGYSELKVTKVGKHKWKVLEDWVTPFGTIPKGAPSDGGSIPRLLWWFSHPAAEFFEASIFHDYFYEHAIETKAYADNAFYQIGLHFGAKPFKAKIAKFAVSKLGRGKY